MAIALIMEAASTSETSANYYQTTRRNNPEDSHHHGVYSIYRSGAALCSLYVLNCFQERK
jgi:hypothetical protein